MAVIGKEFLSRFQVGFEVEFMHPDDKTAVARKMTKALGVKVTVPKMVLGLNKEEPVAHNEAFVPTATHWKIEPDFSGGADLCEIVTGPMPYSIARLQLIKVLKWIEANGGYTTAKCGIHLNVSVISEFQKEYKVQIYQLDRLKLCLNFDEEFIYKLFPNRRHNVYARSVRDIVPASGILSSSMTKNGSISNNYLVPSTKYYGINFLKQPKNYLEFRYLGGKNYSKKTQNILDCLEHICSELHNVLDAPAFNANDRNTLFTIVNRYKKVADSFSNIENFILNYKDIIITIDLQYDPQIIRSVWERIRPTLYTLVMYGNMTKGSINLDTDLGRIQVKNAKIDNGFNIEHVEFFDCELEGLFYHVYLYGCTAKNSQFDECEIVRNSEITGSKLRETMIKHGNTLEACYIDNLTASINGHLKDCVIARGKPGKMAKLENCMTPKIHYRRS